MTGEEKNKESSPISQQLDIKSERTVGELLLSARESAGLSLEAVSLETKIPRRSLEYLETDNFEALPAKVYVRGFLRTYASLLGLDYSQVLGKFELQTGQTHTSRGDLWEVEEAIVEEEVVSPRLFQKFVLPAIVVVVVLVALIWMISRIGRGDATPPRDVPGSVEAVDDEGQKPEDGEDGSRNETDDSEATGQEPEEGTGKGIKTVLAETARLDAARLETATPPEPAGPMQLKIMADAGDTTWFDMVIYSTTDAGPDSSFRDFILFPGQIERLSATDAFFFRTVGNAGGFSLELDGKRLPSLGRDGVVRKNVMITRDGVIQR